MIYGPTDTQIMSYEFLGSLIGLPSGTILVFTPFQYWPWEAVVGFFMGMALHYVAFSRMDEMGG